MILKDTQLQKFSTFTDTRYGKVKISMHGFSIFQMGVAKYFNHGRQNHCNKLSEISQFSRLPSNINSILAKFDRFNHNYSLVYVFLTQTFLSELLLQKKKRCSTDVLKDVSPSKSRRSVLSNFDRKHHCINQILYPCCSSLEAQYFRRICKFVLDVSSILRIQVYTSILI